MIPPVVVDPKVVNAGVKHHKAIKHSLSNNKGHDGISSGGYFAILVFVSLLFYVLRKCREIHRDNVQRFKPGTSDHLSQLL